MAFPDQSVLPPLARTTTLTERAYEAIRAAIVDRTLPPGAPVREAALARQLVVSRTPVRDALTRLHEVSLVSFQEIGRAIVVTPSRQALCEAYELREALEAAFRLSDAEFHLCVAIAAGTKRLAGYLASARDLAGVLRQIDFPAPGFSVQFGRAHLAVAEAISSGNAAAAEAAMRGHIKEVLEHLLLSRPRSHDD